MTQFALGIPFARWLALAREHSAFLPGAVSYSRATLASFSAALGRVHATADPAGPPPELLADRSAAADMDYLAALLEAHRQRAAQPGIPALPPPTGDDFAARFVRLRHHGLTARECEVVGWIAQGKRDAEIAAILGCAPKTVGKHVEHLLAKLGAETRLGAAKTAADLLQAEPRNSSPPDVHPR